jgi:hypothetical protein
MLPPSASLLEDLDSIPVELVDGLQLTGAGRDLAGERPVPSDDYRACMDERKLLVRLARGAVAKVAFDDLCGWPRHSASNCGASAAATTSSRGLLREA